MKSTRWVFLALAILVSVQVLWWAYLVMHQQSIIADLVGTPEALEKARNYRTMVLFEGAFFVFVWALGVWFAYNSIRAQWRLQEERRSFLSAITHELKTPLSTIQLSLETISRPNITEEQKKNFVQRSLLACKKLFHEIETILTYNESERISKKEIFLLKDFLHDLETEFPNIVFSKESFFENIHLHASYLESKSILKNIIDNAIKYSSNHPQPKVIVNVKISENNILFMVVDNGIGLNHEELKQVFTPFWRSPTAKNLALEGSGLGLTLSSKLANKNGVKINITSPGSGQGTSVSIQWPQYGVNHVES